jgi:lambda repressor-like predicted transcriptional regulator
MPEQNEWEAKAANILKAQLKLNGISYAELADRIGDKEPNVRNKLSRGKFSAAYFLQCLTAVGSRNLQL